MAIMDSAQQVHVNHQQVPAGSIISSQPPDEENSSINNSANNTPETSRHQIVDDVVADDGTHSTTTTSTRSDNWVQNDQYDEPLVRNNAPPDVREDFCLPSHETFCRYLPFVLILCGKDAIDHIEGIIYGAVIGFTFWYGNITAVEQAANKQWRRMRTLLAVWAWLSVVSLLVAFRLLGDWTWLRWFGIRAPLIEPIFNTSSIEAAWSAEPQLRVLLFDVLMADMQMKLLTVNAKLIVMALPSGCLLWVNRGYVYLAVEAVSQSIRCFLPIVPWLVYLLSESPDNMIRWWYGVFLTVVYFVAKAFDINRVVSVFRKCLFGSPARLCENSHRLQDCPSCARTCPMCRNAINNMPMQVACGHIFCSSCAATWEPSAERTCPLCRAVVEYDPRWRDGSTAHFMQLF